MKTKAQLQPNDELEFSIELTAPVSDWKVLLKQLRDSETSYRWPLSTMINQIEKVLNRLDQVYVGGEE